MEEIKKATGATAAQEKVNGHYEDTISQEDIFNHVLEIEKTLTDNLPPEWTGEYLLNFKAQRMETLLDPILPKAGVVCLAGGSDTGKSCLLRQLAIDVVTGSNSFLNFGLNTKYNNCIFVATEDDAHATSFLLTRQAEHCNPSELKDLRFVFETENLLETLVKKLDEKPADVIIIDCFADAYSGDLKDSQKIRTFLHQYQQLAIQRKLLIIFLHHTAKRTENFEPSKNNLLSGQGFESKMRMVMELRVDLLNPNTRHLCIVKGNYLPASYKKESFVLEFNESSFTFTNTGQRTPFEFLVKQQDDAGKTKYEEAKTLVDLGYNYEIIASKLGYQSKGSVSKLFDKAKKNGWDK